MNRKFDIHIDALHGSKVLEITDLKNISRAVDSFALKYSISDPEKVARLKKYVRKLCK